MKLLLNHLLTAKVRVNQSQLQAQLIVLALLKTSALKYVHKNILLI